MDSHGTTRPVCLGVIGGSGLYHMEGTQIVDEHVLDTPFGHPSDAVVEIRIGERSVMFLPRHGRGHHLLPTEVNARANVYAFKQLGVTHLLAVSAVGIMREEIAPGHMIVPHQIFDRTKGNRPSTFFGDGIVGHVAFADPFCEELRSVVIAAAGKRGAAVHDSGIYVCMEGPQFSTRAESKYYRRQIDATVIGMTALPEAKLAREAEMCYAMLAMGTDYDCWHESEDDVDIESVLRILKDNAALAKAVVEEVASLLHSESDCPCLEAARFAIVTAPDAITDEVRQRLRVLYGHYLDR